MPDTTVTVRQDGTGDYTTITSAAAAADVSSGYYKIEIDDSSTYTESVDITSVTGTPTASNYVWVTVSEGNRHSGVAANSGHARLVSSSARCMRIFVDYTRIEYLQLNPGYNHIGIYTLDADGVLISRCLIIGSPTSTTQQASYGLYIQKTGDTSNHYETFIDNCVITATEDCGIFHYADNAGLYVDYCVFANNVASQAFVRQAGLKVVATTAGSITSLYNTIIVDCLTRSYSAGSSFTSLGGTTNVTDYGSHNTYDASASNTNNQGSITDWVQATSISDTTSGSSVISVVETARQTLDYTLTNLTVNPAAASGTNRIGSEPDSRQDFSIDIAGNPRTTKAGYIDRGAYQVTVAPASIKYWDGAAWANSTAVQYWNGSAWTDVTGVQYWNGSAWTDPS